MGRGWLGYNCSRHSACTTAFSRGFYWRGVRLVPRLARSMPSVCSVPAGPHLHPCSGALWACCLWIGIQAMGTTFLDFRLRVLLWRLYRGISCRVRARLPITGVRRCRSSSLHLPQRLWWIIWKVSFACFVEPTIFTFSYYEFFSVNKKKVKTPCEICHGRFSKNI